MHGDGSNGPLFFLSYARTVRGPAGTGPDRHVREFFHDLMDNVDQLVYLGAGEPTGFMDQEMRGGVNWPDELMHAAGTCQVLVALLSTRYLKSEWCRREWHAFSQRAVRGRAGAATSRRQGCIVPVLWAPFRDDLPEHIGTTQIFSPDSTPESSTLGHYLENGMFGLMRMGFLKESYEIVTWQLAMHIANIFHSQRTEAREFVLAELDADLGDDARDR
jgi:TIR domain